MLFNGEAQARTCTQASYYGDAFHGKTTANGERFNMYAMTAAHPNRSMLGKRLKVTDPDTGRSVTVRINDVGPFVSGRGLDLSKQAFINLFGSTSRGVDRVCYTVI